MKKRLLLLLILPLLASCGNKNKGSSEVQSSKEDESSIISESSESTTSENEDSSSSSEEPDVPENELVIPSFEEVQKVTPFNFDDLNRIPLSMAMLILENTVDEYDTYNYLLTHSLDSEIYDDERIVGAYRDCFESYISESTNEYFAYFDDLSTKNESIGADIYETGDASSYYSAYTEEDYSSYSVPDKDNKTVFSYLEIITDYYGDIYPWCNYSESVDTVTEEEIIGHMYYPFYQSGVYTAFNIASSSSYTDQTFFGEKDGQYYFVNYYEAEFEDNYTYQVPEQVKMHAFDYTYVVFDRLDDEKFVINSSHSLTCTYALTNIFGDELDEPVAINVRSTDAIFGNKELEPFEMPTDYELLPRDGGYEYYTKPAVCSYYSTGSGLEYRYCTSTAYCGNNLDEKLFMVGVPFEYGDIFNVATREDMINGYEITFESASEGIVEPYNNETHNNCYRVLRDCYIFFTIALDSDWAISSVSAIVIG